jgi:phosphate acyltransferase
LSKSVKIAIDAMGGDRGAEVCVPAGLTMLRKHPDLYIAFVGLPDIVQPYLDAATDVRERASLVVAQQVVSMDESAADALRKKKKSSLRIAIDLVKSGEADACVSAGNTGALMATGRFVLKTLPGIDRPAIMASVPTLQGSSLMLDLGASVDCTAEHLYQFAIMGSVVASQVEGINNPKVGLLNIGEEDMKGNDTVREAAAMLTASSLNYIGFVEGSDISQHKADVVVADGFSGNVALKVMEGTARLILQYLKDEFGGGIYGKIAGAISLPVLRKLADRLDPRHYNGATLIGLNGIVIKSHGGADEVAFQRAIKIALIEVEQDVPAKIGRLLAQQAD